MLLDTNILIGYLNGEREVVRTLSKWKIGGHVLCISSISVAETLALSSITSNSSEADIMRRFLATFISIPFDNNIAETAAVLRRVYQLELPDAAIVATAINRHLPLVTRDRKLRKVTEVTLVDI